MLLRLAEGVRIRKEPFGGLLYEPSSGTTVELDRGAYRFVELASRGITLENGHKVIFAKGIEKGLAMNDVVELARSLCETAVMERCDSRSECDQSSEMADPVFCRYGPNLMAPEAVHWAVTYRCDTDCPDRYAARHRNSSKAELATS